ncbi:hypothetical protein V2G26_009575 [Clonostachys chloroleuca]
MTGTDNIRRDAGTQRELCYWPGYDGQVASATCLPHNRWFPYRWVEPETTVRPGQLGIGPAHREGNQRAAMGTPTEHWMPPVTSTGRGRGYSQGPCGIGGDMTFAKGADGTKVWGKLLTATLGT